MGGTKDCLHPSIPTWHSPDCTRAWGCRLGHPAPRPRWPRRGPAPASAALVSPCLSLSQGPKARAASCPASQPLCSPSPHSPGGPWGRAEAGGRGARLEAPASLPLLANGLSLPRGLLLFFSWALQSPRQPTSPVSAAFQALSCGEEGGETPRSTRTGGFICFPLLVWCHVPGDPRAWTPTSTRTHSSSDATPPPSRWSQGSEVAQLWQLPSALTQATKGPAYTVPCQPAAHLPPPSLEGSQGGLGSWVGPWVSHGNFHSPAKPQIKRRGRKLLYGVILSLPMSIFL